MAVQNIQMQRRRERVTPAPAPVRLRELWLLAGAVVIVCLLSVVFLAQTGRVALAGQQLQALERERIQLVQEAEQYEYRIARASRLDVVSERAARLGLRPVSNDQLRYATVEMPAQPVVASNP